MQSGWQIVNFVEKNLEIKPKEMRHILQQHGVAPEYMQLYRVKNKALEMIQGKLLKVSCLC